MNVRKTVTISVGLAIMAYFFNKSYNAGAKLAQERARKKLAS